MKSRSIFHFFLLFLLVSCGSNESTRENSLYIPNKEVKKTLKPTNFFNRFSAVALKSEGNHFLIKVEKLAVFKDSYCVLSRGTANRLSEFSDTGKELFSISSEDVSDLLKVKSEIHDFEIVGDKLFLLLGRNQKIIIFDKRRKVVQEIKLPFVVSRLKKDTNGWVFYKTLNPNDLEDKKYFYHLIWTDNNFNFVEGKLPFKVEIGERIYFDMVAPFGTSGNLLTYTSCFNDTISFVNNKKISDCKLLRFQTGAIRLSEFKDRHKLNQLLSDRNSFLPFGVSYFSEINSRTFFQIGQNATSVGFIHNQETGQSTCFEYLESDIGYLPCPILLTSQGLFGIIDEDGLSKLPQNLTLNNKSNIYEKVINSNLIYVYCFHF
jgi:hypothetical protein